MAKFCNHPYEEEKESHPFQGGGSVVVDLLLCVPPIVCGGSVLIIVLVCITLCPL